MSDEKWVRITHDNYTETEVLNLGFSAFLRVVTYNNDGEVINTSVCETDAQGVALLLEHQDRTNKGK